MVFKDLEDRILEGLSELPNATVILLGRIEYAELRTRMTATKHGLSYKLNDHNLEVQWNHFVASDLRLLSQVD